MNYWKPNMNTIWSFALALNLILAWTPAEAQQNDPQLLTAIDGPPSGSTAPRSKLWIHGWAFHCTFGQQPQSLRVYYTADDGFWVEVPIQGAFTYSTIPVWRTLRQDVKDVFAPYCPQVSAHVGFGFTLAVSPPPGTRTFLLLWEDRTGTKADYLTLVLTP